MTVESFIASLATVSKDLALWASMQINRGQTLEEVIARMGAAIAVVDPDNKRLGD
jgi:hypothetical protein